MNTDPRRVDAPAGAALVVCVLVASTVSTAIGGAAGAIALSRAVRVMPSGSTVAYLAVAAVLLLGGLAGFVYVLRLFLAGPFEPPEE